MKKYLIITTALTTICFAPEIMAQCTENTDCAPLGYTETSCPDGGLKCPLGNYWYCPGEQCSDYYKYTCTGTGYAGGSGEACNGKYQKCNCNEDYIWNATSGDCEEKTPEHAEWGKCNGYAKNCKIGDGVYSDGTCDSYEVMSKTKIAEVIYKSADGRCAQAIALKSIGQYKWGYGTVPDISYDRYSMQKDYLSCKNTQKIITTGDKNTYPAAWAAYEYKTEGTKSGDWCLPAGGILYSAYYNHYGNVTLSNKTIWSSSTGDDLAWSFGNENDRNTIGWLSYMLNNYEVQPVIEF